MAKPTVKQLLKEIKTLEKENEDLRYRVEILESDVQYYTEKEAGAGL